MCVGDVLRESFGLSTIVSGEIVNAAVLSSNMGQMASVLREWVLKVWGQRESVQTALVLMVLACPGRCAPVFFSYSSTQNMHKIRI